MKSSFHLALNALFLNLSIFFATGCANPTPRPTTTTSTPPAATSPAPLPIEVRYDPRLSPDTLTPQRKTEVLKAASENASNARRPWFIWVLYNKQNTFTAKVYFAPDQSAKRIRKGHYAHVMGWSDLISVVRDGPSDKWPKYVQISTPEEAFDNRLTVPSGELLPFDPDGRFLGERVSLSDSELVEIADLVRPHFAKNDGGPILHIKGKGDLIRVFSGSHQGPLSGGGRFIEVKRKPTGGFELANDGIGIWHS